MGIPRFYRWISERYPQINQQISDVSLLPEFDNLYLDLNGIIHQCTHPSDDEVCEELGEAHHIPAIFAYIDRIVSHIVKPKKLLFLAVDGVAPRAKLNQQRSRRFRAGKELYEKNLSLQRDDDDDNESSEAPKALFDSNCITPGTEFMYRLSSHLQYFIRKKLKEDPSWRDLTVIFSGQDVPGEGEHKIVEYIRRTKMQPGYPPNVRHCMYGSDADLMLLGLMTHEPHFTLVREVVNFGGGSSRKKGKDDNSAKKIIARQTKEPEWQLVHLSLFRQYLNMELSVPVRVVPPSLSHHTHSIPYLVGWHPQVAWYDMERALDDFIFLTFLLGNDFIPHSPTLDISEDAIALLLGLYRDLLPQWGNYLTEAGVVTHPEHLEGLCQVIGSMEEAILTKRVHEERKFRDRKRYGNGYGRNGSSPVRAKVVSAHEDTEVDDDDDGNDCQFEQDLLHALSVQEGEDDDDVVVLSGSPEFQATKWAYYGAKFGLRDTSTELLTAVKVAYVEALVWCAGYYFQGVPSWSWFYPFHYSPMLSDLTDIASIVASIHFDVGVPFLPFQQLLSTLPPTSATLVPPGYQRLMTDPTSPIASFYPISFEIDMDGKRNAWEGVNILPFIDASRLVDAIHLHCPEADLTDAERRRNRPGTAYVFKHDLGAMDTLPSTLPGVLDDIACCHSSVQVYELPPPRRNFRCTLTDGLTMPIAGFPSLYSLPLASSALSKVGVNCFGMSSKKDTLVHVNYPHLHEAKVVAISTRDGVITCSWPSSNEVQVHGHSPSEQTDWAKRAQVEASRYLSGRGVPGTGGVSIGAVTCLLHVLPLQGMVVDPGTGAMHKKFGRDPVKIPFQLAVLHHDLLDLRFQETAAAAAPDRFPLHTSVVVLRGPSTGLTGTVVRHHADQATIGVRVSPRSPEPPFGYAIAAAICDKYYSSFVLCQKLGIQPSTLGRITGSLLVNPGRYDIGLNIKFKKELMLAGYCRYIRKEGGADDMAWTRGDSVSLVVGNDDADNDGKDGGIWEYTDKAFYTLVAFQRKFPRVYAALETLPYSAVYDGAAFLNVANPSAVKSVLESIKTWLSQLDIAPLPLIPVSSATLPRAAIHAIQAAGDSRTAAASPSSTTEEITVESSALFRPVESNYDLSASSATGHRPPLLGDRVVSLSARGVPFGLRGTVVASHQATACVEVLFDAKFSGGTSLGGTCSAYRGKLVHWSSLLVVSTPPPPPTNHHHRSKQLLPQHHQPKQSNQPKSAEYRPAPNQPTSSSSSRPKPPQSPPHPPSLVAPLIVLPTDVVTPPPPPSTEKMHSLIAKWAEKEESRDLHAPAHSMAQYFNKLQARPDMAPPPARAAIPPYQQQQQPPLPPPYQQQPQGPPKQPQAAKMMGGLLLPAQVLKSKLTKHAQ
ncbi:hypothetical protein DYB38_006712 [Aphanomyces astaci]|uniref:Uncharacterized protein n=1 Tax=Aphanomyces astaci TaxID=112090 RepID=A0A397D151_APHAT|nr:hypothetical protein DYB38_006712 [Aphanomyces astaci]